MKIVNYLLLAQKEIDLEDKNGDNILTLFLLDEKFDMAFRIIRRGGDVNFINCKGKTVLHFAIEFEMDSVIQYLLQNKADVYIEDSDGENAMQKALRFGYLKLF